MVEEFNALSTRRTSPAEFAAAEQQPQHSPGVLRQHLCGFSCKPVGRRPAVYVVGTPTIRWNGSVHPCDLWNARQPLGSLQTHSFEEIWKSEKYRDLRAGLYSGHPTFEHCLKCDRISQDNLEKRKLTSPLAHTSISRSNQLVRIKVAPGPGD